jgi:hypothetical protein
VKTDAPGAGGDPGRDVNEFAASRTGPAFAEGTRGEDPGGAGGVVGQDRGGRQAEVEGKHLKAYGPAHCHSDHRRIQQ